MANACVLIGYYIGNIAGPFFYKTSQALIYSVGIWSMIVFHLLEAVAVALLWGRLRWEDRKRDRLQGSNELADGHTRHHGII